MRKLVGNCARIPELEFIIAEDWNSAFRLMSAAEICVSMRLHGLIFGTGGSAPLGLCYDPKVAAVSSISIKVSSPQPDRSDSRTSSGAR